jgi:hypothetical protein
LFCIFDRSLVLNVTQLSTSWLGRIGQALSVRKHEAFGASSADYLSVGEWLLSGAMSHRAALARARTLAPERPFAARAEFS